MSSIELDDKFIGGNYEAQFYLAEDEHKASDERRIKRNYPTEKCLNPLQISEYLKGKPEKSVEDHLQDCEMCNRRRLTITIAKFIRDLSFDDINGFVRRLTWEVITGDPNQYSPKDRQPPINLAGFCKNLDRLVDRLYPHCKSSSEIKTYLIIGQKDPKFEKHLRECNGCCVRREYVK